MIAFKKWRWRFLAFASVEEGRPIQRWFNSLSEDDKDEIRDLLLWLQNVTNRLWRRPEFDPLDGEDGISEIRIPGIRSSKGNITYRIYGFFGPSEGAYTFLHGTDKDVKNDKHGKWVAKERLAKFQRGEASVYEFEFEIQLDSKIDEGT